MQLHKAAAKKFRRSFLADDSGFYFSTTASFVVRPGCTYIVGRDRYHRLYRGYLQILGPFHVPMRRLYYAVPKVSDERDPWLYFLRCGEQMDDEAIPPPMHAPPIAKAMKELKVFTHSDRERYEARLKFKRDQIGFRESYEHVGHERGLKEGLREGLEAGLRKGVSIGSSRLCEAQLGRVPTSQDELMQLIDEALSLREAELRTELLR